MLRVRIRNVLIFQSEKETFMKKKGVLIAGVIGFVAVVSLFARQTQDIVLGVPTTTGGGLGQVTSGTLDASGQVVQGYNTGFVPPKYASQVPVPSGFANVTAPTEEQMKASFNQELEAINQELKNPDIAPERKKELVQHKKDIKKQMRKLKNKNGK